MVEGISTSSPPRWQALARTWARTLARALAGFLPVGVFALVLLWAMGEWGVTTGIVAGTALGALMALALTRLIAAYPLVQWIAAAVIGLLLTVIVLSLF